MGLFDKFRRDKQGPEKRSGVSVPQSDPNFLQIMGLDGFSSAGETVTIEKAIGIPAIWAAVNFLSGLMAGLPLHLYKKDGDNRDIVKDGLGAILHDAVNDEMTSFAWRKAMYVAYFTGGRHMSFIERNKKGEVINIWPLIPRKVTIQQKNNKKKYVYKEESRTVTYQASDVIDLVFMPKDDLLGHRSPIMQNKATIALMLAITKYGSRFFNNGGVPPFTVEGPFETPGGMARASNDLERAVTDAAVKDRLALVLPRGHKINPLGVDPEKSQMVESQRFLIEQAARIYSIPPVFLQDMTHGTFSNTEQQDLQLVKHTIKQVVEQFEQELNLKLFGRKQSNFYAEMNMDGVLRGDFITRMDGTSKAIMSGQLTPNEARRRDNKPDMDGGNRLYMQGAMAPIEDIGKEGQNNE